MNQPFDEKYFTLTYNHLDNEPMRFAPSDHTVEFRLYDDDDLLYFSGKMSMKLYDSHRVLEPLDYADFHWGCTRLDCLNPKTGEWEQI